MFQKFPVKLHAIFFIIITVSKLNRPVVQSSFAFCRSVLVKSVRISIYFLLRRFVLFYWITLPANIEKGSYIQIHNCSCFSGSLPGAVVWEEFLYCRLLHPNRQICREMYQQGQAKTSLQRAMSANEEIAGRRKKRSAESWKEQFPEEWSLFVWSE